MRNMTFGEIIGSSRPNTHEKAIERWAFLKSEYKRKETTREVWKEVGAVLLGLAMFLGMIAVGIAALYIEL